MKKENFETSYRERRMLSKALFVNSSKTKDFIEWLMQYEKENNIFSDAVNNYEWGEDKFFAQTYTRFQDFKKHITKDEESAKQTCLDILEWGGVLSANKQKIETRPDLCSF